MTIEAVGSSRGVHDTLALPLPRRCCGRSDRHGASPKPLSITDAKTGKTRDYYIHDPARDQLSLQLWELQNQLNEIRREQRTERQEQELARMQQTINMLREREKRMLESIKSRPVTPRPTTAIPSRPAAPPKSAADVILAKHDELEAEMHRMQKNSPPWKKP